MGKYLTAPRPSTNMPKGIPYIIGNEAAERFSFYGMKAILTAFMTKYLMDANGELATMSGEDAKVYVHLFGGAVYITPLVGSIIADAFFGKYMTIMSLSIVYCLGHLALAINDTQLGLAIGLTLIAIGAGGIKPCVSAHVGDQFGKSNVHLMGKCYAWFYFSINLGAFTSMLLTPWLLHNPNWGPQWAFGVPGGLMLLATIAFWTGRKEFVHIPPTGKQYFRETFTGDGLKAIGKLCSVYIFIAMFWSLFEQTASAWVLQAGNMDLTFLGYTILPSQIQSVNPILVLLFIPLFNYWIYPAINKFFELTYIRKISIGLFIAVTAFLVSAFIEMRITNGHSPSFLWQILAYILLTGAEIMISITGLEFSYTQAPKKMKSLVLALFLSSVAVGNWFTAAVNYFIQNEDGSSKITGVEYYLFFSGAMLITAILFVFVAKWYKPQTYIHEESAD